MRLHLPGNRMARLDRSRPWFLLSLLLAGCVGMVEGSGEGEDNAELLVPAQVKVNGRIVSVEADYLPRVVQCENPGAPYEALKAQAIAARTYLTYRTGKQSVPTIKDGESDQVYTCPSNNNGRLVAPDVARAVEETRSRIVMWNGDVTAGFFVAGASRRDDNCKRLTDPTDTERFLTFNFGLIEGVANASKIGFSGDNHNRGAFGQRLANCLADTTSMDAHALLRYFYGSDVQVDLLGTRIPTVAEVSAQAASDITQAMCWSETLDRPMPTQSCVQSASDGKWYQCQEGGKWIPSTAQSGPLGACDGAYSR